MKREEIIAKWAGMTARERDAWAAEAVFGWGWSKVAETRQMLVPPEGDPRWDWTAMLDNNGIPHWLPHYTTDIAAAWAVFDRFFSGTLEILGNGYGHECKITGQYGETRAVVRGEYTVPEAICLAAIIAKLTEVPANESA